MSYDNTNRISVWRNQGKEQDSHPDFTGTVNIEGKEYFVDLWKKKPDASDKAPVLSGKVKPKDGGKKKPDNRARDTDDFDDSDDPF